jgi:hypothetical protein
MAGRTDINSIIRTMNKSITWCYLCKWREKHVNNYTLYVVVANTKSLPQKFSHLIPKLLSLL